MKKAANILVSCFLLLNLLVFVQAQSGESPTASFPIPPRRQSEPVAYSAEATSESLQMLNDGNKIARITQEKIFKDSKGRTRRESSLNSGSRVQKSIMISDPIAGFEYYLNPLNKTANRVPLRTFAPTTERIAAPTGYSTKSEPLESRTIEGFETTGRRSITTIAPGISGNEQAIETISESWYAPALRTIVFSKRSDPRMGDNTYQMKNIKLGEPDSSLFIIPADYKIVDGANITDRYFIVPVE